MQLTTLQNKPLSRLGLGGTPNMDPRCPPRAHAAGIDYFFFYNLSFKGLIDGLQPLLAQQREALALGTGSESRDRSALRRYLDQVRSVLNIDTVDIFFAEYISPDDDMQRVLGEALDELYRWKQRGLIRYVGATVHSRPLALELLESGKVEVLMQRYNMAHRGVEEAVLPAARQLSIPVIAFTCTRWGTLLKGHNNWSAPAPRAPDCYHYALDHPAVHLALTAPATLAQLDENLSVLGRAKRLDPGTKKRWQEYGALVYGEGKDAFETEWP